MKIVRVLNNNAVLASDQGGEKAVLLGRGIGWSKHLGDAVDMTAVQQTFVPDGTHSLVRLASLVGDLPLEVLTVAEEIVKLASVRLPVRPTQALVLTIADHLHVVALRQDHDDVVYPLHWEVSQLYPDELAVGREAVELASRALDRPLPPQEAVAFAMHLVNAQFASGDLARTVAMTGRIRQVLAIVRTTLGLDLDEESMNVARFVTHLRYLFVRMAQSSQIDDPSTLHTIAVEQTHPEAFRTAERVRGVLEMDEQRLTRDEVVYLALHIARLSAAARDVAHQPGA